MINHQPDNQRKVNLSQAMSPNDSYENLAIIIVLSSCGAAILLAILILICCHLFIRSKDTVSRTRYYTSSGRGYTLERQTTSSDDNNMELFSCCIEESVSQPPEAEDSDGDRTVSPRSSINGKAQSSNDKSPNTISTTAQVRFVNENGEILVSEKKSERSDEEINKPLNASHRRSSGGIIRQQSFEVPDEEASLDLSVARAQDEEDDDGKSPETIRREYRELWQLRTTLELEEERNEPESSEGAVDIPMQEDIESSEQRSTKFDSGWYSGDSGYRSMERRDYSIDSKTESIYRQFIANSGQTIKSSHQSIQEEQESEAFV